MSVKSRKIRVHGFGRAGRRKGQLFPDIPRPEGGFHRVFLHILEIIGDPVHELMPKAPEILVFHAFLLVPARFFGLGGAPSLYFYPGKISKKGRISALDAKMGQKARFSPAPGSRDRPDGDYSGIRKKALLDASNCGIIINGRKRDFGKFEKVACGGRFCPQKFRSIRALPVQHFLPGLRIHKWSATMRPRDTAGTRKARRFNRPPFSGSLSIHSAYLSIHSLKGLS